MTFEGTTRRERHGHGPQRRVHPGRREPALLAPGPWGALHAGLSFALEVAMLGALGYAGFRLPMPWGAIAGVGLPLAAVLFWALFMAPRARRRIVWPWQPLAALGLFAAAGIALLLAKATVAGWLLIAAAVGTTVLAFWLRRRI